MAIGKPARDEWRVTVWSEWVADGVTREDRASRLSQVPAVSRDSVRQEVVWYFQRLADKR